MAEAGAEQWFRTDEAEDVAGSVRHCLVSLSLTYADDQAWKWVALSLHAALQGACVCHLATTAPPTGIIDDENLKGMAGVCRAITH